MAGAALLAVAGYEIYQHWNGINTLFSGIGNWLGGWGATLGKAILMGIAGPFGMIAGEISEWWRSNSSGSPVHTTVHKPKTPTQQDMTPGA